MTAKNQDRRRRFIAAQRADSQRHFARTAAAYDARYGELSPTHLDCVADLLAAMAPGQELLDAACGTGKYFGVLTRSGHLVLGIDQSAEMLALAREKWPDVPTRHMALQYLRDAQDLRHRFAGLMCVDAMEWVLHDDWPIVLEGFHAVLAPGSPAYINIEVPGEHEQAALAGSLPDGARAGEILVHGRINYFPNHQSVLGWLADAGFQVVSERTGDDYWHLLVRSPDTVSDR